MVGSAVRGHVKQAKAVAQPLNRATRRGLKAFLRTRRSAVALEMAIVALPFLILLLGVMEVTYDLYVESALNYILAEPARQIWTGQIPVGTTTAQASSTFITSYVCANSGGLLECGNLYMKSQKLTSLVQGTANYTPTADFFHIGESSYTSGGVLSISGWTVCPGGPNNLVLLEAVYAGPTFLGALIPAFSVKLTSTPGAARVHPTYASIGFGNYGSVPAQAC